MTARFHYDEKMLARLLHDELGSEDREVQEHVEKCDLCQEQLETLSAGDLTWDEVCDLMRTDDLLDYDVTDPETTPESKTTFLEASEDPNSLGKFGRYEIQEILGRGGMGIVMRGIDSALDRHCAIKVLAPELASSAAARKRFSREARSAAAVVHPHVVPIQTVDEQDGLPYLVMPVVEGRSLAQRVERNGPLDVIEVVRIAAQIADGLSAAHSQGLVHRDIKPANVLLENEVERVQITDFGLARAVDDASMTRSGVIAGTPQYMSPEQAHGDTIDHRSDLFSLGSVMYFMLTGRSPFRAETSMGVLNRICNDQPRSLRSINADVPPWLATIVNRLLEKSPDDRFQTADELASLLMKHLTEMNNPDAGPIDSTADDNRPSTARHIASIKPPGRFRSSLFAIGFAFFVLAGTVFYLETNKGTLRIETNSAVAVPLRIVSSDETVDEITVGKNGATTRLKAGNYVIEIDDTLSHLEVKGDRFTLRRGDIWTVAITRVNGSRADVPGGMGNAHPPGKPVGETGRPLANDAGMEGGLGENIVPDDLPGGEYPFRWYQETTDAGDEQADRCVSEIDTRLWSLVYPPVPDLDWPEAWPLHRYLAFLLQDSRFQNLLGMDPDPPSRGIYARRYEEANDRASSNPEDFEGWTYTLQTMLEHLEKNEKPEVRTKLETAFRQQVGIRGFSRELGGTYAYLEDLGLPAVMAVPLQDDGFYDPTMRNMREQLSRMGLQLSSPIGQRSALALRRYVALAVDARNAELDDLQDHQEFERPRMDPRLEHFEEKYELRRWMINRELLTRLTAALHPSQLTALADYLGPLLCEERLRDKDVTRLATSIVGFHTGPPISLAPPSPESVISRWEQLYSHSESYSATINPIVQTYKLADQCLAVRDHAGVHVQSVRLILYRSDLRQRTSQPASPIGTIYTDVIRTDVLPIGSGDRPPNQGSSEVVTDAHVVLTNGRPFPRRQRSESVDDGLPTTDVDLPRYPRFRLTIHPDGTLSFQGRPVTLNRIGTLPITKLKEDGSRLAVEAHVDVPTDRVRQVLEEIGSTRELYGIKLHLFEYGPENYVSGTDSTPKSNEKKPAREASADPQREPTPLERLQGSWRAVPTKDGANVMKSLTFYGDRVGVLGTEGAAEGIVVLPESNVKGAIDFVWQLPNKDPMPISRGLYEIRDRVLWLRMSSEGKPRPTDLETNQSDTTFVKYIRERIRSDLPEFDKSKTLELQRWASSRKGAGVATTVTLFVPGRESPFKINGIHAPMAPAYDLTGIPGFKGSTFTVQLFLPDLSPRGMEFLARNSIAMTVWPSEFMAARDSRRIVKACYLPDKAEDLKASSVQYAILTNDRSQAEWLRLLDSVADILMVYELSCGDLPEVDFKDNSSPKAAPASDADRASDSSPDEVSELVETRSEIVATARKRFRLGEATIFQVIEAEQMLLDAQLEVADAEQRASIRQRQLEFAKEREALVKEAVKQGAHSPADLLKAKAYRQELESIIHREEDRKASPPTNDEGHKTRGDRTSNVSDDTTAMETFGWNAGIDWKSSLQGQWQVEMKGYDDEGKLQSSTVLGHVTGNRITFTGDGEGASSFTLKFGSDGPPKQIDIRPILTAADKQQLRSSWDFGEPPNALINPVFHGIVEEHEAGYRICMPAEPGERPTEFAISTDLGMWILRRDSETTPNTSESD